MHLASLLEFQFPPTMSPLPVTEGSRCLKREWEEEDAGYFVDAKAFYGDDDLAGGV